jgi:hypothetical protein
LSALLPGIVRERPIACQKKKVTLLLRSKTALLCCARRAMIYE